MHNNTSYCNFKLEGLGGTALALLLIQYANSTNLRVSLEGSGTPDIINVASTTNANRLGLWAFGVDQAQITGKVTYIHCQNIYTWPTNSFKSIIFLQFQTHVFFNPDPVIPMLTVKGTHQQIKYLRVLVVDPLLLLEMVSTVQVCSYIK